jgi:inhibitor of KinA
MQLAPLGDSAVVVSWPDLAADERRNVLASVTARFTQGRFPGVTAVVPAYASVTIFYDLLALRSENLSPYARLGAMIAEIVAEVEGNEQCNRGRVVELEVSYGGSDGPDLIAVATQVGLSAEEVIARHSARRGFLT